MASPTRYYVDSDGGSDVTGDGSELTPWATTQYALTTGISRDTSNGDRISHKRGTSAQTLTAPLDITSYGSPSYTAPLVFDSYGSGDRPIFDGDASYSIIDDVGVNAIYLMGLELRNVGANHIVRVNDYCAIDDCVFHGQTNSSYDGLYFGQSTVSRSHFYNIVGRGVYGDYHGNSIGCYFENSDTVDFTYCIHNCKLVSHNIVRLSNSSPNTTMVVYLPLNGLAISNSIFANGATGEAIHISSRSNSAINNIVSGFNGVGGVAFGGGAYEDLLLAGNCIYNCNDTDFSGIGDWWVDGGNNEWLTSPNDPFPDASTATFANRFTNFAPSDVGNVRNGAWPNGCNIDKGAVQHEANGGGAGIVFGGMILRG